MQFDREWEMATDRPDARVVVRTGGQPVRDYAVMLQVLVGGTWRTVRLIDNHLDRHHMHRYAGLTKLDGEHFAHGTVREAMPKAIRYIAENVEPIIENWTP